MTESDSTSTSMEVMARKEKIVRKSAGRKKKELKEDETKKWWRKSVKKLEKHYTEWTPKDVKELFNLLEECMRKEGEYYKKEYSLQLILASLERICSEPSNKGKLKASDFRVSTVVDCIRSAKSPQTHQAALALLTELTPLFKDAVLDHVMSIFTFMGTGMVKKEDTYTFVLIQKTLDAVVPALLESESENEDGKVKKIVETMRIFAVALRDIPDQRRMTLLSRIMKAMRQPEEDIEHPHLWAMIALLYEQYVAHWTKAQNEGPQAQEFGPKMKDLAYQDQEFALEFCWKFPAVDQLNSCVLLFHYLNHLSQVLESGRQFRNYPEVFEYQLYPKKQLNHFRYMILGFMGELLVGEELISKVAGIGDEAALSEEIGDLGEELVGWGLKYLHYTLEQSEMASLTQGMERDAQFWKVMAARTDNVLKKVSRLLPASLCLDVIKRLMEHESLPVRKNAVDLLNSKLQQNPTPFTLSHIPKLGDLTVSLCGWLDARETEKGVILPQMASFSLKLLVRIISPHDKRPVELILKRVVGVVHCWRSLEGVLMGSLCVCVAELVIHLGSLCLSSLPQLIPDLLDIVSSKFCRENALLLASALTSVEKVVECLSEFLSPYVSDIMMRLAECARTVSCMGVEKEEHLRVIRHRLAETKKRLSAFPGRILLPALSKSYKRMCKDSAESLEYVFGVLDGHIKGLAGNPGTEELNETVSLLFEALDLRSLHHEKGARKLDRLENETISCVVDLSLKLSENTFRPLIFRLTGWAEEGRKLEESGLQPEHRERLITFHRLMNRLADELKTLFVLFAGQLIKMDAELLDGCNFSKTTKERVFPGKKKSREAVEKTDALLRTVLDALSKACLYDTDKELVTTQRFTLISQPIIDQLDNTSVGDFEERTENHLIPCLLNLVSVAEDDSVLKPMNYSLLLKTRSQKRKTRKAALSAARAIYAKLGEDVTPLLPETMPFLAEALEDENEEVEAKCQSVIEVLEGLLGESLQQYL